MSCRTLVRQPPFSYLLNNTLGVHRIYDFLEACNADPTTSFRISAISGDGCRLLTQKLQEALARLPRALAVAAMTVAAEHFPQDLCKEDQAP